MGPGINCFNKQIIKGDSNICVLRTTFLKIRLLHYVIIAERGGCLGYHGSSKEEHLTQSKRSGIN